MTSSLVDCLRERGEDNIYLPTNHSIDFTHAFRTNHGSSEEISRRWLPFNCLGSRRSMDAKDPTTRSSRPRTLKRKVAARRASPGGIVEIQVPLQDGLKEKDLQFTSSCHHRHTVYQYIVFGVFLFSKKQKWEPKKHAFAGRFLGVDPNSVVERRTEIHVEEGCDRRETSAKGSGRKSPVAAYR